MSSPTRGRTRLHANPAGRAHLGNTTAWEWTTRAACCGVDVNLFYGHDEESAHARRKREAKAKAVCAACPVRRECLDDAVRRGDTYGVRGGQTPDELTSTRTRMRRGGHLADVGRTWARPETLIGVQRRLRALAVAGHGTVAVSDATGLTRDVVHGLRSGRTRRPHQHSVNAIHAIYPRLLDTPPGPQAWRSYQVAERQGWHGAADWAHTDIDDPTARPRSFADRVATILAQEVGADV